METWDAVRARRNVRQYTDQPIPREDLERILEAGRRSPSGSNWQPWTFVVVTDRDQLVELAKAWPRGGGHIAQSAATIALVTETPPDELFHGTVERFLPSILSEGLNKGRRHHVHLSKDVETARRVGARRAAVGSGREGGAGCGSRGWPDPLTTNRSRRPGSAARRRPRTTVRAPRTWRRL